MKQVAENFHSLPQALKPTDGNTSIGTVLGNIGFGTRLAVSEHLAQLRPADTDNRVEAALERISGRRPALMTRTLIPNDGPIYSVVEEVRWDCPHDKLPEVASVIEGAFRAAPGKSIAAALYKLRMLTQGRDQRSIEDQEAEALIWAEQLQCYPGDIVLEVLRTWPSRPNGRWWPTWHEVEAELKKRCDRRQALLNFVRVLAERPEPTLAITDQGPSPEQRAKAADHWRQNIRPELQAWREELKAQKAQETPEQALERMEAAKGMPISVGGELAKKIEEMKQGQ
jgi:hypothetical protein